MFDHSKEGNEDLGDANEMDDFIPIKWESGWFGDDYTLLWW